MQNMKCFQCALKHVSTALSYAKEILSGHGKGADLDHRPDFLGELVNLEHHLKLLDGNICIEVKNYRQMIQAKKVELSEDDLEYLRELYKKIEAVQDGAKVTERKQSEITSTPAVLFIHIQNKNYFDLCYKKLKENLTDYTKIYCIKSDIDLSGYDVEKIDYKDIPEQYLYIMTEKEIILKNVSAKALIRIQDFKANYDMKQVIQEVQKNQPYYYYDNFPCIVNKSQFWQYLEKDAPLTYYCNDFKSDYEYKVFQIGLKLDKILCCSNKAKIKTGIYCYLDNDIALQSVKKYFGID